MDQVWSAEMRHINPRSDFGAAICDAFDAAKLAKREEIRKGFSEAKSVDQLETLFSNAVRGTSDGSYGEVERISDAFEKEKQRIGAEKEHQSRWASVGTRLKRINKSEWEEMYEREQQRKGWGGRVFPESNRFADVKVAVPKPFLNEPQKMSDYIIYHPDFPELRNVASGIKGYLKDKYPYWESIQIYPSRTFSNKSILDRFKINDVHLEIRLFVNGVDEPALRSLAEQLKREFLHNVNSWLANDNSTIVLQFRYDKKLANENAESKMEKIQSSDKSDWMYPGGGLQQIFKTPGEREEAVKTALVGEKPWKKASILQRIRTKFKDTLLKDADYRKSVRDVCPKCKQPTLLARYKIGNNTETPDYYECSNCGHRVIEKSRFPFRFKKEKLNWFSIAPKFMIIVVGMFLFSWELITFGGGEFGGQYWIFAILGVIIGLASIVSDFFERRGKEKKKEINDVGSAVAGNPPAGGAPAASAAAHAPILPGTPSAAAEMARQKQEGE